MNTILNPLEELETFDILSFESSLRSIAKMFQGLSFSLTCSTKLAPLTSSDASGEGASILRLGLSLDLAMMEIKPPSEGGILILLDKFDTSAGLFGSNCVPAASFSRILNGGLKMLSILERWTWFAKNCMVPWVITRR